MAPKKTPTKLYFYLLCHFLLKGIQNPKELIKNFESAKKIIYLKGISKAKEILFFDYLPKNYLLKTKLHIKEPSYSIFKKLSGIFGKNKFQASPPQTTEGLAIQQKILVIRSGAMGDVLLATPIIRKLYQDRNGFCDIHIATRYSEIFNNNPYVSKIIKPKDLKNLKEPYDLIINLDMALEKNKAAHITHVYSFYAFGSQSKFESINLQAELFSTPQDVKKIVCFIKDFSKGYIVCHNRIDPSQPYRNVPLNDWQTLLTSIANKTNKTIIQVGMPDMDVAITHPSIVDARGKFNLHELKELISHADLFLGTDAGPLHIAASTETPILSFFTLAHHDTRKPLRHNKEHLFKAITPQVDCYGCAKDYPLPWGFDCRRRDFACTQNFNIQEAIDASIKLLNYKSLVLELRPQ